MTSRCLTAYMRRPYSLWHAGLRGASALAVAAALWGCGAADDRDLDSSGEGQPPSGDPAPTALGFDPDGDGRADDIIALAARSAIQLRVQANPAGVYRVAFAMLGDSRNASLDVSEAETDEAGVATVTLTAPSEPTTFSLRASVGNVAAQAAVSVSAAGFSSLKVVPAYSGRRFVSQWVATARVNTRCSDLTGTPPPDGDLRAEVPAERGSPELTQLPAGVRLAITLRSGHFIGGCAEVEKLTADQRSEIVVPVVDRPLDLSETDLVLGLSIGQGTPALGDALRADIDHALSRVAQDAPSDVAALLSAMEAGLSDEALRSEFASQRGGGSWDQVLTNAFGTANPVQEALRGWMVQGLESTRAAVLKGRLRASGTTPGSATLELSEAFGLAPSVSGFARQSPATWTAEAGDKVVLGATLSWQPSRLLLALLEERASDGDTTEGDPVLEGVIDCSMVADLIGAAGQLPPDPTESCNNECARELCVKALSELWANAVETQEDAQPATLALSATGTAQVNDVAEPVSFVGSWVGQLSTSFSQTSTSGTVSATPAAVQVIPTE